MIFTQNTKTIPKEVIYLHFSQLLRIPNNSKKHVQRKYCILSKNPYNEIYFKKHHMTTQYELQIFKGIPQKTIDAIINSAPKETFQS